jgi:hypothetical protein
MAYANQINAQGPTGRMSDTRIDFGAPATLRKWPSVNKERVSTALGARPYMVIEGTLDECIQNFMSRPESQRHLYEIQTAPQSDLVSATLSAEQIAKLARLKDFIRADRPPPCGGHSDPSHGRRHGSYSLLGSLTRRL